ncbi:angiotensin-converting enzyme-like [Leptidea sinapis]|uniref:angiotensin-converting enzyme-like n=1 Tax=Leptidea sinapis TaxID=189913 RepID=UPI0021C3BD63|nr:angiotensin-converting enzyme-like [Leptidea sinapis]
MKFSKKESVLRWLWLEWRGNMKQMRLPYLQMVDVENKGAKRNGYKDMGETWRDELEMPNLRKQCYQLYEAILPLYKLLHGVVRYWLREYYGEIVPKYGPIPAHLLGDLWSQDWAALAELILPTTINLDERIKKLNWTAEHLVRRAEDFYLSLGLPSMTDSFWRESIFSRLNNSIRCHGTAADMFKNGDYRLLYCFNTTINFEDLYVIHHEMGHIQYFMAYKNQPGLFQQANTALHETIGDTVMLGVNTPQHLHRLGLINDNELFDNNSELFYKNIDKQLLTRYKEQNIFNVKNSQNPLNTGNNLNEESIQKYESTKIIPTVSSFDNGNEYSEMKTMGWKIVRNSNDKESANSNKRFNRNDIDVKISTDDILMLKHALGKIPQIPFALVLEEYRWRLFAGGLGSINNDFWKLSRELQGIDPAAMRGEENFDAGANYHVADNVPCARYFLSNFLQYQIFEKLCKSVVNGRRNAESLPNSIPLYRCDIYGSKIAGKILKDIMSRGSSQHWQDILQEATNIDAVSANSIINYYTPVYKLLNRIVNKYNIHIGW